MAKTDKELTAEVMCAYLHAWGNAGKGSPNLVDVPAGIKAIHNAFSELKDKADQQ